MYGLTPKNVWRPIFSPPSTDSSRNALGSFPATLKKAETGVNRSALTDLTTGTRVAFRANSEKVLKSGIIMRGALDYREALWATENPCPSRLPPVEIIGPAQFPVYND